MIGGELLIFIYSVHQVLQEWLDRAVGIFTQTRSTFYGYALFWGLLWH
jgi:hypothetical protein